MKEAILQSVKAVGVLGLALTVPNVLGAMAKMGLASKRSSVESIYNARRRMVARGLLEWREDGFVLTQRGEQELHKFQMIEQMKQRHGRWDGKWRVIIFDIPDRRRGLRDKIRHHVRSAGFQMLQASVWAYPYNCEEFIAMLKTELRIGKDMQYLIVDSIENDLRLRASFGLPKRKSH